MRGLALSERTTTKTTTKTTKTRTRTAASTWLVISLLAVEKIENDTCCVLDSP
jgi:hypothetical protein